MNAVERDFIDAVRAAVPEIAQVCTSWKRDGVCFQLTVCSSYGAERIKLRIEHEAIRRYVSLNRLAQSFARRRLKEFFAKRYFEYRADRGYYFLHTKLADPEWTITNAAFVGESPRAPEGDNVPGVSPRFAVFGDNGATFSKKTNVPKILTVSTEAAEITRPVVSTSQIN